MNIDLYEQKRLRLLRLNIKPEEEKIWAESIINLILPLPPPWTYPIRPLCSVAEMVFTLILALQRWTQSSSVAIPEEALLQEIPT